MRFFCAALAAALTAAAALAQPPAADLASLALSPGSWSYNATALGGEARFMDSSATARVIVRCVRSTKTVLISVRAVPSPTLAVGTSFGTRTLPAAYDPAEARVSASLAASDPILDWIAFSRGRFSLAVAQLAPVVLPARPEPARAIEDCRN